MVTIQNSSIVPGPDTYVVCGDSGDYADLDLVLCADAKRPDFPIAQLQAQFVKYGPVVYQFNTPEELGAALYAIDPESAHDAVALYKEQLARDAARAAGTLAPADPAPVDTSAAPDTSAADQTPASSGTDTATPPDSTATTTPDSGGQVLGDSTVGDVASSTPDVPPSLDLPDTNMSTTTPDIALPDATSTMELPDTNTSTTTPDIVVPDDTELSTTTPQ